MARPYHRVAVTDCALSGLSGVTRNEIIQGLAAGVDGVVRVAPILVQPIASSDVAVADVALGAPVGGIVEVAGPETFRLDELVRLRLGDEPEIVVDRSVGYVGAAAEERTLLPGDGARLSAERFDAWLREAAVRQLEQSLGLGSREILVVRVIEAVPLAVAVEEVRQREPFEGAAVPRRCSSTRATASPPATRSASASRRLDAAVPLFDLAPGAYLRLLDRARPQR